MLVIGGAAGWLLTALTFNPFMVVSSTEPAQIWGPALGRAGTLSVATLLALLAAFAPPRWTLASLAVWAVFLAIATHRIVERTNGAASDQWLGMTVQALSAEPTGEPSHPRCTVTSWTARCHDETGRGFTTLSALPMAPLVPGRWDR